MGIIIVGGVVKKDNKYLLVQEAQEKCYGKWNIPAGHLDPGETIFDGAKREVFEECGFNVELTGVAHIGNRVLPKDTFLAVVFSTEIIDGSIAYDKNEILDAKWFTYNEIINMKDDLRAADWIINAVSSVENNRVCDINLIKMMEDMKDKNLIKMMEGIK